MTAQTDAERAVLEAMRSHVEKGRGEITIVITPGVVDVQEGKRTRFEIKS